MLIHVDSILSSCSGRLCHVFSCNIVVFASSVYMCAVGWGGATTFHIQNSACYATECFPALGKHNTYVTYVMLRKWMVSCIWHRDITLREWMLELPEPKTRMETCELLNLPVAVALQQSLQPLAVAGAWYHAPHEEQLTTYLTTWNVAAGKKTRGK